MSVRNEEENDEVQQTSLVGLMNNSNASVVNTSDDEEYSPADKADDNFHDSGDDVATRIRRRRQSFLDDVDLDPITLPKSTHTLLFTEPINSVPFAVGIFIAALSILCLLLALFNNGLSRDLKEVIPANVDVAVKTAQYTSILIALIIEEEIPIGLYLLRRMPRQYFKSTFPELRYRQFVFANVLRIAMGYLFLINVLVILIKDSDVIQIFFDFIALQFIQRLGDIAFKLAQMSMLSTSLKEATTRRYFRTEFKQTKLGRNGKASWFFVFVYLFNLCGLLSGMIYVSVKQDSGGYQCRSITVNFNEDVWRDAIIKLPNDEYEERILLYSSFSGIYVQDGTRHDGRPVYVERSKFDGSEFVTTSPDPTNPLYWILIPAKIQYCKSIEAWVFMHENIRKSKHGHNSDCPWLIRSETTNLYDIEDVQGPWQVWRGVIEMTDVQISCNECSDDDDCNLNGICKDDGSCECFDDVEGKTFLGPLCEVILEDDCRTIVGENYNETYSVIDLDWMGIGTLWGAYNHPVYSYIKGSGQPQYDNDSFSFSLVFTGSRWIESRHDAVDVADESSQSFISFGLKNYHAFWFGVYNIAFWNDYFSPEPLPTLVSDPVTGVRSAPVGVDFFSVKELGDQFGSFGAMYPLQKFNLTGRGYFRCAGKALP